MLNVDKVDKLLERSVIEVAPVPSFRTQPDLNEAASGRRLRVHILRH
jgi:phosphate starvation-inducible protein PhoH